MPRLSVLLVALAMLFVAAGCNTSGVGTKRAALMSDMDLSGIITLAEALTIAQAEVPEGFAFAAELEVEDDEEDEPPAYEVSFFVPGSNQVIEVELDAESGAVLEVEVEEDEDDDVEEEEEGEHEA